MTPVTTPDDAGPPPLPGPTVGGGGLQDHSHRDPVSPATATFGGLAALALAAVVAAALWVANPAFSSGRAAGTPNQLGAAAAGGTSPDAGKALIAQQPCGTCHVIPGVAGANGVVGPSLAGVAGRSAIAGGAVPNTGPEDLKKWILDPPAVKPGTAMPSYNLTDAQATAIVAYLETLK
jgi:cytochrome c